MGVKAISSVEYEDVSFDNPLLGMYYEKTENIKQTAKTGESTPKFRPNIAVNDIEKDV